MRMKTAILTACVVVTMGGCASISETYNSWDASFASWREEFWRSAFENPARVDMITPGQMTRQQVRQMLGEPNAQTRLNDEETWTYKSYRTVSASYWPWSNAKGGSMQSLVVSIVFNRDGVVKKLDSEKQQW